MLCQLRDLFGKPVLLEEDALRRDSLRAAEAIRSTGEQIDAPEFLRSLNGTVTLDYQTNPADKRPLELINKTNQFNLNGERIAEGEWQRLLASNGNVTVSVSYQDKFGPLGKIGVLVAHQYNRSVKVTNWVMSCRAFSRRIEHHTLASLLRKTNAEEVEFSFQATDRNQPLQEFFQDIGVQHDEPGVSRLSTAQFLARTDDLPHKVTESNS
jgi:FkbH-like protein